MNPEHFVLPPNLAVLKISDLPAHVQTQLIGSDQSYVLTLKNTRTPSKVVDGGLARLLDQFRLPKTVVDAVISFSQEQGLDPESMLESAFEPLRQLVQQGFLIDASRLSQGRLSTLAVGHTINGLTITKLLQALNDSEVFQAQDRHGTRYAVKVLAIGSDSLSNEVEILKLLTGPYHPRLVDVMTMDNSACIVMEWVEGRSIDRIAGEFRKGRSREFEERLLLVCRRAIEAFDCLHSQGVCHGDVHPGNILVDADSNVRLIDFSLAHQAGSPKAAPRRGGVAFYLDPEFADARRFRKTAPIASFSADQYSLGAVLYHCLAGRHYLDFSVERGPMLRQICEDQPVNLGISKSAPVGAFHTTIVRALSKRSIDRFADMKEWLSALGSLGSIVRLASRKETLTVRLNDLRHYSFRVAEELCNVDLTALSNYYEGPLSSINYGAAGIALGLSRIAAAYDDATIFATADLAAVVARHHATHPRGFINDAMGINRSVIGFSSLYHDLPGVIAVQGIIAAARGDLTNTRLHLQEFVQQSQDYSSVELTFGAAGLLLGSLLLQESLPRGLDVEISGLQRHAIQLKEAIVSVARLNGLDSSQPVTSFLGIAHGWAGILYAVARWSYVTGEPLTDETWRLIDVLRDLAVANGRGRRWPRKMGRSEGVSGWCNGSAGFVHLWALLSKLSMRHDFLSLAEGAAWDAFDAAEGGVDLCCGLAGRAYALVRLYQSTREELWLERAVELAVKSIETDSYRVGSILTLWKGRLGIGVLAADLQNPDYASMPMF